MEVAGAIIGIAEASARVSSKLYTLCQLWRDAPSDVFQLSDELNRSSHFFAMLHHGIGQLATKNHDIVNMAAREQLAELICDGRQSLTELQLVLEELLAVGDTSTASPEDTMGLIIGKRRRLVWLRRAKEVKKRRAALKETTERLGMCLALLNLTISTEISASVHKTRDAVTPDYEKPRVTPGEITVITNTTAPPNTGTDDGGYMQLPEEKTAELPPQNIYQDGSAVGRAQTVQGNVPAKSPRQYPSSCRRGCKCRCHTAKRGAAGAMSMTLGNLKCGRAALGALRFSALGLDLLGTGCNVGGCRQGRRFENITTEVRLPDWLSRAIITFNLSNRGSPELLIRVCYTVSDDEDELATTILHYAATSDVEDVKTAIAARPSSVLDVHGPSGLTCLALAVIRKDAVSVRVLVQAGADPFSESRSGQTPMDHVLRDLTAGSLWLEQVVDLLPVDDAVERREYTDLHRVIMGRLPIPVDTALSHPSMRADVNTPSRTGVTPLHLAAQAGDEGLVRSLVHLGADPNAETHEAAITPLLFAAEYAHEACIRVLLAAGADPTHEARGCYPACQQPLHRVVMQRHATVDTVDLLLEYGARVEAGAAGHFRPIHAAADRGGSVAALRRLLERGADPDAPDYRGDPPLSLAIQWSNVEGAAVLLAHGARYVYAKGVLHELAEKGNVAMMGLFQRLGMVGVDVEGRSERYHQRTAEEVFRDRDDVAGGLENAFMALLKSIVEVPFIHVPHNKNKDVDVFFDAVESK